MQRGNKLRKTSYNPGIVKQEIPHTGIVLRYENPLQRRQQTESENNNNKHTEEDEEKRYYPQEGNKTQEEEFPQLRRTEMPPKQETSEPSKSKRDAPTKERAAATPKKKGTATGAGKMPEGGMRRMEEIAFEDLVVCEGSEEEEPEDHVHDYRGKTTEAHRGRNQQEEPEDLKEAGMKSEPRQTDVAKGANTWGGLSRTTAIQRRKDKHGLNKIVYLVYGGRAVAKVAGGLPPDLQRRESERRHPKCPAPTRKRRETTRSPKRNSTNEERERGNTATTGKRRPIATQSRVG